MSRTNSGGSHHRWPDSEPREPPPAHIVSQDSSINFDEHSPGLKRKGDEGDDSEGDDGEQQEDQPKEPTTHWSSINNPLLASIDHLVDNPTADAQLLAAMATGPSPNTAGASSQSGAAFMTAGASSAHAHAGPSSAPTAQPKKARMEPPVQQAPASAGKIKKEVPLLRTPPPNKTAKVGPWTGKKYDWELSPHLISWVRTIDILMVQYAIWNEDDDTWKDKLRDAILYWCEAHKAWAYARACRRCRQKRVPCLAVPESRTCAKCVGMGKSCGAGGGWRADGQPNFEKWASKRMSELNKRRGLFTEPHWENFDEDFRKETGEEPTMQGEKARQESMAAKVAAAAADARFPDFPTRESLRCPTVPTEEWLRDAKAARADLKPMTKFLDAEIGVAEARLAVARQDNDSSSSSSSSSSQSSTDGSGSEKGDGEGSDKVDAAVAEEQPMATKKKGKGKAEEKAKEKSKKKKRSSKSDKKAEKKRQKEVKRAERKRSKKEARKAEKKKRKEEEK